MIRPVVVKGLVLAAVACVAMSEPVEASITRYRVTNRYSCGDSCGDSGIWFRKLPGETNGRWTGLSIHRGTLAYDSDAQTLTLSARLTGRRTRYNFQLTYENVAWSGDQLIGTGGGSGQVWNRRNRVRLLDEAYHGQTVVADFRDNSLTGWFSDARGRHIGDINASLGSCGDPPSVPEPGTLAMLGVGMASVIGFRRRRRDPAEDVTEDAEPAVS